MEFKSFHNDHSSNWESEVVTRASAGFVSATKPEESLNSLNTLFDKLPISLKNWLRSLIVIGMLAAPPMTINAGSESDVSAGQEVSLLDTNKKMIDFEHDSLGDDLSISEYYEALIVAAERREAALIQSGLTEVECFVVTPTCVVDDASDEYMVQAQSLLEAEGIRAIRQPEVFFPAQFEISDVGSDNQQVSGDWNLEMIGSKKANSLGFTGKGTIVVVADSGINFDWALLSDKRYATQLDGLAEVAEGDEFAALSSHGTVVAQIVAMIAPEAKIASARVCSSRGCVEHSILRGRDWAAQLRMREGVPIIYNESFGKMQFTTGSQSNQFTYADWEQNFHRLGVYHIGSAGNNRRDGRCRNVHQDLGNRVQVGSVNRWGEMAASSSVGPGIYLGVPTVQFVAPGEGVPVPGRSSEGASMLVSGTSFASPHTAGSLSIILGKIVDRNADWSEDMGLEALYFLANSAVPLDTHECGQVEVHGRTVSHVSGYGIVDVHGASLSVLAEYNDPIQLYIPNLVFWED